MKKFDEKIKEIINEASPGNANIWKLIKKAKTVNTKIIDKKPRTNKEDEIIDLLTKIIDNSMEVNRLVDELADDYDIKL